MTNQTKPQNINGIHAGVPCFLIPKEIIGTKGLPAGAIILLSHLGVLADDDGICKTTDKKLGKLMRETSQTIILWVRCLEKHGYVKFRRVSPAERHLIVDAEFSRASTIAQRGGE